MSENMSENIKTAKNYVNGGIYIISYRLETDEAADKIGKYDANNDYSKRYKSLTDKIESISPSWSETTSFWCVVSHESIDYLKSILSNSINPEIDHLLIINVNYSHYTLIGEPKEKDKFDSIFEGLTFV